MNSSCAFIYFRIESIYLSFKKVVITTDIKINRVIFLYLAKVFFRCIEINFNRGCLFNINQDSVL